MNWPVFGDGYATNFYDALCGFCDFSARKFATFAERGDAFIRPAIS